MIDTKVKKEFDNTIILKIFRYFFLHFRPNFMYFSSFHGMFDSNVVCNTNYFMSIIRLR